MFEYVIDNETYISCAFYEVKDKIQLYKATRQKVEIPFVFAENYDKLEVKEGIILEILHLGNKNYDVIFECENVIYKGRIYTNHDISIGDIEVIENKREHTDLLCYVNYLYVGRTEMKNKLLNYMQVVNEFDKFYKQANLELKNLLK